MYDSNEINDVEMSVWATAAFYTPWLEHYLRPTHSAAAKYELPSSNAPYFCHAGNKIPGWGPAAVARFYKRLLTDVGPGLRRLWGKRSCACSLHGFLAKSHEKAVAHSAGLPRRLGRRAVRQQVRHVVQAAFGGGAL
eukprot:COSAG04_NODE_13424_length_606_cov_11.201183_2_plen_136_part_01